MLLLFRNSIGLLYEITKGSPPLTVTVRWYKCFDTFYIIESIQNLLFFFVLSSFTYYLRGGPVSPRISIWYGDEIMDGHIKCDQASKIIQNVINVKTLPLILVKSCCSCCYIDCLFHDLQVSEWATGNREFKPINLL